MHARNVKGRDVMVGVVGPRNCAQFDLYMRCMYVCNVCMFVFKAWVYACNVCMCVMYVCMHVCMYVCMYASNVSNVCMYACIYVCYVCM